MSKTKWYTRALYLVFALALVVGLTLVPETPVMAAPFDIPTNENTNDCIGITNASGMTLESIPANGTIYIWAHDETNDANNTWDTDAWTQESVTVTLKVYRGDGARLVASNSYSAIEMTMNSEEFRTAPISVAGLGVEPGYQLQVDILGATSLWWYGPSGTKNSVGPGNDPYFIRAQIEFVEGGPYDIDGTMTLRVKDDSLNDTVGSIDDLNEVEVTTLTLEGTGLTKTLFKETGNDTGIFEWKTTPNAAEATIWCNTAMDFVYANTNTTLGATVTKTAYVYPYSPSSVSFSPATITPTAANVDVVVTDRDESPDPTGSGGETIPGSAVVVKSLAADDSVIDSLVVPTNLTETAEAGKFDVTVNFGAGVTQLDITGAAKLEATYTDPSDPSDVSTATAPIGTTVDLYDATGTLKGSYTTITDAISAASSGWTVKVSEAYNSANEPSFPIVVNKAKLTIESIAGAASTIIEGTAGKNVINIQQANVTIGGSDCGFTIKGNRTGGDSYGVYLGDDCATPTIQGNVITGKLTGGIWCWSYGVGTFNSTVTIKDNTITNTVPLAAYGGIFVRLKPGSLIDNNDISGFGDGISLYGSTTGSWASPITVSNNKCYSNYYNGIGLDSSAAMGPLDHVIVRGNECYDNTQDGIEIWGSSNSKLDNIIITGNSLYNNKWSGINLFPNVDVPAGVYVFGNNIYGNTSTVGTTTGNDYGIWNQAGARGTVPATHNWWGDASGPSPVGTGDAVSANVAYTPWLGASVSAGALVHGDGAIGVTSLNAKTTVGVQISGLPTDTSFDNAIGAALYSANPKATPTFTVVENSFTDVYVNYGVETPAVTDEVILKFSPAGIDADCKVYAWNETYGTWEECTHQDYSSYAGGYVWVKVHSELNTTTPTTPTIEGLAGLPFAIGTAEVVPPTIEDQLAPIADELQMVYYFDNATKAWSYYWPTVGGDLDVLTTGSAYWINVSADCTIDSTPLYEGWNLIVW